MRAREAVRTALGDRDESVRRAAMHSAGLWRDGVASPQLVAALKSGQPAVQRVAAEALGRLGDARAVPDLIAASASPADRVLEHSLTYALIEIGDSSSTAGGLSATASGSKRAALLALDQMGGGQLRPDVLIPLFTSSDPLLAQTAWWIADRHPEWGGAFAGFFETRLAAPDLGGAERDVLARRLAQFAGAPAIQGLLARTVASATTAGARVTALRAMAAAASSSIPASVRVKELPDRWADALSRALTATDDDVTREAVSVARAIPAGKGASTGLQDALLRVARDAARPAEVRVDALTARGAASTIEPDLFELLRRSIEPANPPALRTAAAAVLEKTRLDRDQLLALARSLETAGPLELPRLLPAFDNTADATVGLAMVAALDRSTARSTVRAEVLRPRLTKYPESVQRAGEALLASVNVDASKQAARLDELLGLVQNGDVSRGQTVFNGSKAACLSCHAIGYIGGRIGPDLTRIGQVRSERDLLEAVVFPNVSFARGFEPVVVRTRSGQLHGGVLRNDAPDEVVLGAVSGPDTRIPRKDVAEIEPGTVSLMPPGYAELLTRQELADLLAFLRAAR
jgi:putative heme-binding domain-containing protein